MNDGEPLWKSCASWLCDLEILPDNHRVLRHDATMRDLAYALRDGVLLCHVASTVCPGSVDLKNVNQRPQMAQFLCLKNIKIFLTACREKFSLKETDLFQPSMLYDYTDFARVLQTLSKLSNCDVAKKKKGDVHGFPQPLGRSNSTLNIVRSSGSVSGATRSQNQVQEEEIYNTLANDVDEDTYQGY